MMDIDELIFPENDENLLNLLERYERKHGLGLQFDALKFRNRYFFSNYSLKNPPNGKFILGSNSASRKLGGTMGINFTHTFKTT